MTDIHTHIHFKWNVHVNELLKAPRADDCYDAITTRKLKMVPRILLWLVSLVLRTKNGGFSRIYFAKIRMVYILFDKIQDSPHGDAHGTSFGDTSSIMPMLHNMQLRQDERYMEDFQR